MKQYYLHDGLNEKGPFDIEQLKLESINKNTPIWYDGLENWTTAGEVDELKNLFIPMSVPPPLKKNIEPIIPTPSRINPIAPAAQYTNDIVTPKKKISKTPLIIGSILLLCGIIGWLIYQNRNQEEVISDVQQKITQQEQEQVQKDQQENFEEQEKQKAKNIVNAANTAKYMGYRNNWKNFIAVSSNQYTYVEAGGISDLDVIINNQTEKLVDEVQVRIDYIKANGGNYKTETVSVTNIGPNATKSVSAPTSDRGTSVKMEIVNITAKSFHFCYPSGMEGNQNADPYFCK